MVVQTRGRHKTTNNSDENPEGSPPPQEERPSPPSSPPSPAHEDASMEGEEPVSQDSSGSVFIADTDATANIAEDLAAEEEDDDESKQSTVDASVVSNVVVDNDTMSTGGDSTYGTNSTVSGRNKRNFKEILPGIAPREDSFVLPALGSHEKSFEATRAFYGVL